MSYLSFLHLNILHPYLISHYPLFKLLLKITDAAFTVKLFFDEPTKLHDQLRINGANQKK